MARPLLLAVFAGWHCEKAQSPAQEEIEMFRFEDQTSESALCVGIIAALVWGVGLSVYGFQQPQGELSWLTW
jgi:hypothetical protein